MSGARAARLALLLTATALSLLLLECAARVWLDPPRYHDAPLQLDPQLGFRGIPDHHHEAVDEQGSFRFELNADGLRGREIGRGAVQPDVRRIAFVGDSFLVGQALREEHLMTSLTAAALRERGLDAEVYNLSAIDYGTGQELLLLRGPGRRIRPEAVVLALYPGNDLVNNALGLAGRTAVSAGDYIRPYWVEAEGSTGELEVRWSHPLRAWLRHHSRLFATLERHALAVAAARGLAWLDPWPPTAGSASRLQRRAAPREDLELFRRHDPGDAWGRAWSTTFALLRAFRDECDAQGARLLVLVIPTVDQVQRTAKIVALDIEVRRVARMPLDELLDWNLPERRLVRFFRDEGIEARMLLPRLRGAARAEPRLYTDDEHLAPSGHALASAVVVDWLLERDDPREPPALSGRPVRRLPDASGAPPRLDFSRDRHRAHLGDGWIGWRPRDGGDGWGWTPGGRALVALPASTGELVVRGYLPPRTRLPLDGELEIVAGPRRTFRLERSGPFEIRLPVPLPLAAQSSGGYTAVILARQGDPRSPLFVHGIGFETVVDR